MSKPTPEQSIAAVRETLRRLEAMARRDDKRDGGTGSSIAGGILVACVTIEGALDSGKPCRDAVAEEAPRLPRHSGECYCRSCLDGET